MGNLEQAKVTAVTVFWAKRFLKAKKTWSSVTRDCKYESATRDGLLYRIYDTPGINSPDDLDKTVDVEADIRRCLYCTSPGFHAIVFVMSTEERISKEDMQMLGKLDLLLGESAFRYMILVFTKLDDEDELKEMMNEAPEIVKLNVKCDNRHVIFGENKKEVPISCVRKFDEILTQLIKKNARLGKEYYTHKLYDKAMTILELDKQEYMATHPYVSGSEALEIVRVRATEGGSPRDEELRSLDNASCCSIS